HARMPTHERAWKVAPETPTRGEPAGVSPVFVTVPVPPSAAVMDSASGSRTSRSSLCSFTAFFLSVSGTQRQTGSVLLDLAALHEDVTVGLYVQLAARDDRNVLALDLDGAVFLHRDAGIATLQRHFVSRIDDELIRDLQHVVFANGGRSATAHFS